jgi:hydrogenase nickel incorporation protein HypA/HybF
MHEFSIASQVVEVVQTALREAGGTKVSEIRLRVGEFSFISAEQLRFAVEELSRGTPLEGAELTVTPQPGKAICGSCGSERIVTYDSLRASGAALSACKECGSPVKLMGGTDCLVENVMMEIPEGCE